MGWIDKSNGQYHEGGSSGPNCGVGVSGDALRWVQLGGGEGKKAESPLWSSTPSQGGAFVPNPYGNSSYPYVAAKPWSWKKRLTIVSVIAGVLLIPVMARGLGIALDKFGQVERQTAETIGNLPEGNWLRNLAIAYITSKHEREDRIPADMLDRVIRNATKRLGRKPAWSPMHLEWKLARRERTSL